MPATQVNWIGLDMFLYWNTGTFASPVWTLVDNCQDLKRAMSRSEAELNSRKSTDVMKEPGLKEKVFNFSMINDETDTNFTGLRTAEEGRTVVEFAFANGAIATSGTTYTRQETKIFGWEEEQPLTGGVATSITVKPNKGARNSRVVVP